MIFSKQTKNLIFKYKHIILLLLVTVFLVFYNNPYKETFDDNEERTAIYRSAISQFIDDLKIPGGKLKDFISEYHNNVLHGDVAANHPI